MHGYACAMMHMMQWRAGMHCQVDSIHQLQAAAGLMLQPLALVAPSDPYQPATVLGITLCCIILVGGQRASPNAVVLPHCMGAFGWLLCPQYP